MFKPAKGTGILKWHVCIGGHRCPGKEATQSMATGRVAGQASPKSSADKHLTRLPFRNPAGKKLTISSPLNFTHKVHVGFDAGEFTGLPRMLFHPCCPCSPWSLIPASPILLASLARRSLMLSRAVA